MFSSFCRFHLLSLSQVFMFFLLPKVTLTLVSPDSLGGNETLAILADLQGNSIANAHTDIDLLAYESFAEGGIENRDADFDWFNITYKNTENLLLDTLQERKDIHVCNMG